MAGRPKMLEDDLDVVRDVVRGQISEIAFPFREGIDTVEWSREGEGICLRVCIFDEGSGKYCPIFDTRPRSVTHFRRGGVGAFARVFQESPCYGRFSYRNGQFISLGNFSGPNGTAATSKRNMRIVRGPDESVDKIVEGGGRRAYHRWANIAFVYDNRSSAEKVGEEITSET